MAAAKRPLRIVIIGAGIGGLAAAVAAARHRFWHRSHLIFATILLGRAIHLLVLRARLAAGPQLRSEIEVEAETLDIPEGSLLVAADELGVRTRRGEWWLPG